ncbi:hypothetical protein FDP41_009973 [Naegleria fowleri]|uniref:Uncharacterized protein n=1 Tax=Naegleria fowleri TaxID=5763 RepID=A0A6A5BCD9_NAEFO|nr:uncharacterized protein FDP41_009973 [Naegleria fowleri]KAF0971750.1 hypothetical protein FDP41_009973 [Naegleria fowleri]CAG4710851.1 unnamed protein product [Naegleria fowleri]
MLQSFSRCLRGRFLNFQKPVVLWYCIGEGIMLLNLLLLSISTFQFVYTSVNPDEPFSLREERREDLYALWPVLLIMFLIIAFVSIFKVGLNVLFFMKARREQKKAHEALRVSAEEEDREESSSSTSQLNYQSSRDDSVGISHPETSLENNTSGEGEGGGFDDSTHEHQYYVVVHNMFSESFSSSFFFASLLSVASETIAVLMGVILMWRCHHQVSVITCVSFVFVIAFLHCLIACGIIMFCASSKSSMVGKERLMVTSPPINDRSHNRTTVTLYETL